MEDGGESSSFYVQGMRTYVDVQQMEVGFFQDLYGVNGSGGEDRAVCAIAD